MGASMSPWLTQRALTATIGPIFAQLTFLDCIRSSQGRRGSSYDSYMEHLDIQYIYLVYKQFKK